MDNNLKQLDENQINNICDNIQIFCADEEVEKEFGKIENESKRSLLTRVYEFANMLEDRKEDMLRELDYRVIVYTTLKSMVITDERLQKVHKQELDRTKEIIVAMKTAMALDERKLALFHNGIAKKISDLYDTLSEISLFTSNALNLDDYSDLRNELTDKFTEELA